MLLKCNFDENEDNHRWHNIKPVDAVRDGDHDNGDNDGDDGDDDDGGGDDDDDDVDCPCYLSRDMRHLRR